MIINQYLLGCPACGGDGFGLGDLGNLTWARCRACGLDFYVQPEDWRENALESDDENESCNRE